MSLCYVMIMLGELLICMLCDKIHG